MADIERCPGCGCEIRHLPNDTSVHFGPKMGHGCPDIDSRMDPVDYRLALIEARRQQDLERGIDQ